MPTYEDNWRAAMEGDFAPLVASWVQCDSAQRAAIDAVLALVGDRAAPSVERAATSADALRCLALGSVLSCDAKALESIAARQRGGDAARTRRWRALIDTEPYEPPKATDADVTMGRGVENAVLNALEAALEGDEREAVTQSRRGVRMARADGLVLFELLASIVLARCRRLEGRPHLALRILTSVASVAPPLWRGWMAYERALAGGPRADESAFPPLVILQSVWQACESGDPSIASNLTPPTFCGHELALVRQSHLPDEPPSERSADWIFARNANPPSSLAGLCVPEIDARGERSPVCLYVRPGSPARRVFSAAASLCAGANRPEAFELAHARTWSTIAHLASATTHERSELFERVYGFSFLPARHSGTLRVLLHRVRQTLPAGLELDETDTLIVKAPVLLPDPRVRVDMETLILGHLARAQGRSSARAIAEALGVSSRTVQQTLRELIDDGTCTAERDGRRIEYVLEDTTLSEPTLSRLHPRGVPQM